MLSSNFSNLDTKLAPSISNKVDNLQLITRTRTIRSSSKLGKLNTIIKNFNDTKDAAFRYQTLVELYFQIKLQLAESNTKPDSKSALENWLQETGISEKIGSLSHYAIQESCAVTKINEKDGTNKNLIKSLHAIKDRIKDIASFIHHSSFDNLIDFYISGLKRNQESNLYSLANDLITNTINFKHHLLTLLANQITNADEIKKLHKLYSACDEALHLTIEFIKNTQHAKTLQHVLTKKLELSHHPIQYLHGLTESTLDALIDRNVTSFDQEMHLTCLGGCTNTVYKLKLNGNDYILKVYPSYDDYKTSYENLIQVRNKLGALAPEIIGAIYFEREFLTFDKNESRWVFKGRLEITEFFPNENLHNKIHGTEMFQRSKQMWKNLEKIQDEVIDCALQILSVIVRLNDLKIVFPDIKPSNFLLTAKNEVRVSDYKTMFVRDTIENIPLNTINYTLNYLPPEIKAAANPSCNLSDMQKYAAGLTLYELATGDLEYKDQKSNRLPDLGHSIFTGTKGKELGKIVKSLLNDNPNNRMELHEAITILTNLKNTPLNETKLHTGKVNSAPFLSEFNKKPLAVEQHVHSDNVLNGKKVFNKKG